MDNHVLCEQRLFHFCISNVHAFHFCLLSGSDPQCEADRGGGTGPLCLVPGLRESVVFPVEGGVGWDIVPDALYQVKDFLFIPRSLQTSEGTLHNQFSEASITLLPEPDKDTTGQHP